MFQLCSYLYYTMKSEEWLIIIAQHIMTKFIVNEFLMYAISKYDTDNIVDIKNMISKFYCEEAAK